MNLCLRTVRLSRPAGSRSIVGQSCAAHEKAPQPLASGLRRLAGVQADQRPAAARSASARSVRSHVNSGSSRPKWP